MRCLVTFAVLAVMVSGCSGNDDPAKRGSVPGTPVVDVDEDADTGAISGVVVDAAIRPIGLATVRIADGSRTATTSVDGQFVFEDLAPGTYFLSVNATGFFTVQSSAEVAAGAVSTLRIQMAMDLAPVPYHETYTKDGFIQYGASIATFAVNLVTDEVIGQGTCNCYIQFETGPDAVAIVIEATWNSGLDCAGTDDDMYWQIYESDTEDIHIESAFEANPIYAVVDKVEAWGEDQTAFEASVTEGSTCPRYNQQYQSFYSIWYLESPPEGWSIVAGTA